MSTDQRGESGDFWDFSGCGLLSIHSDILLIAQWLKSNCCCSIRSAQRHENCICALGRKPTHTCSSGNFLCGLLSHSIATEVCWLRP